MPWTPAYPSPTLSQSFRLIMGMMWELVAVRCAKLRPENPVPYFLAWTRLQRWAVEFEALVARFRAGRLRPRAPRAASCPSSVSRPRPRPPLRGPSLPRDFGWLLRLVPGTVAHVGQVRHMLADPEMVALLAASPRAVRMLRQLCRMLDIREPDFMAPQRRKRPPANPEPTAPSPEPSAANPAPPCAVGLEPPAPAGMPEPSSRPSRRSRAGYRRLRAAAADPPADPPTDPPLGFAPA